MRNAVILFLMLGIGTLSAQTRTITGRIITEDLQILPGIKVQNTDTVLLASADIDGRFEIQLPPDTKELLLSSTGMEWATVKIPTNSCDYFEIIMMYNIKYGSMSAKKIDKLQRERVNKLPELYLEAFEMDLFKSDKPCMTVENRLTTQ